MSTGPNTLSPAPFTSISFLYTVLVYNATYLSWRRCVDSDVWEPEETHLGAGGSRKLHQHRINLSVTSVDCGKTLSSDRFIVLFCFVQFRMFTMDVLQEMENNIRLDQDYISVSERLKGLLHNAKLLSDNYLREWNIKWMTAVHSGNCDWHWSNLWGPGVSYLINESCNKAELPHIKLKSNN